MPEPQTAPEVCREKDEIIASIWAAANHVIALNQVEIIAIAKCDLEELKRVEDDLRKATAFKASLLERYHSHLQAHGCK